ncbi:sigma-70 family RNA polymerase sigma factor [Flavobacteriaceae bacterium 3-367]
MNQRTTDQEKLIEGIKANNQSALKKLYQDNFFKVEKYILKNSGSKMQAKDIYQEAFTAVWKNIRLGKFVPEGDTALNGYLFRIARNKWTDYLRSSEFKKKTALDETHPKISAKVETDVDETDVDERDRRLHKVIATFKILGEPCRHLLTIFYFEKKSLREIAKELNIGEASARNKKYRCIEKLRALVLTPN